MHCWKRLKNGSQLVTIAHTSTVLQNNPLNDPAARDLPVFLPPGYNDDDERRYPVIWVLAPFTSWGERYFNLSAWDENIVQRMDRLIAAGEAEPAILAFPDCFTAYGGSQYVNSSAVGRYEDYVTEELVPVVDKTFHTLTGSAHRGVMGYSSGGYGALMLAMRHPDLFGAAASHSGDVGFETCYWPDIPGAVRTFDKVGGVTPFIESLSDIASQRNRGRDWFSAFSLVGMSACYSPNEDSPHGFDLPINPKTGALIDSVWARWKAVDPLQAASNHIDALKSLKALYVDCGITDEYNLFLGARQFRAFCNEHRIALTYDEFDGGHFNVNWRYELSLPLLSRALTAS